MLKHFSSLQKKLDSQWNNIEEAIDAFSQSPRVQKAAKILIQQEHTSVHVLSSPKLKNLLFRGYEEQEAWLKTRISTLLMASSDSTRSTTVQRYKLALAEVLTHLGGSRLKDAHLLFEEVFGRSVQPDNILGEGLSSFAEKLLTSTLGSAEVNSQLSSCQAVVDLFVKLDSPGSNSVLARAIQRLYQNWQTESSETAIPDLCTLLFPFWKGQRLTHNESALKALDRWGFFIVSLVGYSANEATFLQGYRLCRDICDELEGSLTLSDTRRLKWITKRDEFYNVLGLFGSFIATPIESRDINTLTRTSLRLQRSRNHVDEINDELISCGFAADEVRASTATPRNARMNIPIARSLCFVQLPLGRVLGATTEVLASCYHGPNCGLWVAREVEGPQVTRTTIFWTRYGKAGLYYLDINSNFEVSRYCSSFRKSFCFHRFIAMKAVAKSR